MQRGDYDIGRDIVAYKFPENMRGMSVLDIGTGAGWFATYFEQCGAEVTTVDARGYSDFDVVGRAEYPDISTEKPVPDRILPDGRAIYYSSVSKGFWIMKEILGLKAEYVNSRIYDVTEVLKGRKFDLVFIGAVLMHLRDPIGALMAMRPLCAGQLIATSGLLPGDEPPTMRMFEADLISWWLPNKRCLIRWFKAAGFSKVDAEAEVNLTRDKPFVDEAGNTSATDQRLALVRAKV
jgi:SAM-dependent methyltransferase